MCVCAVLTVQGEDFRRGRKKEKERRRRKRKKIKRRAEEPRRRWTMVGQNGPTNSGKQERALPLNTLAGAETLLRCHGHQASTSSRTPQHRAPPPHHRRMSGQTITEQRSARLRGSQVESAAFSSPASHAPLLLPEPERVWWSQISCQQRRPLGDFKRRDGGVADALLPTSSGMPCDGQLC